MLSFKFQKFLFAMISVGLITATSNAALLPVPNSHKGVSFDWSPALQLTWQGIKERNINAYTTGLVHRPKSESPGDAVSEGQGYGMIVALYANDQATFNQIWAASEKYMWNGKSLNWRVGVTGKLMGGGAATDADQDVAAMLIFADSLVKAKIWEPFALENGATYSERAQTMLNTIWNSMVETRWGANGQEFHLKPGDGWGGYSTINVGYYTPAFYRIFAEFDNNSTHQWLKLADQGYATLEGNPGALRGLGPDWCDGAGALLSNGPGYNAFDGGKSMYKDAIRILWRVATDAVWFDNEKAKAFLQKSLAFIETKGGAKGANFYQLDGSLVCDTCKFIFNGETLTRPRREHSPLTIAMWATAAAAVGTSAQKEAFSTEMKNYYAQGANFWGKASDTNLEDTLHNEMYFDQFLAWFGMSLLSGKQSNILYDLANPPTPVQVHKLPLQASIIHVGQRIQIQAPQGTQVRIRTLHGKDLYSNRMQQEQAEIQLAYKGLVLVELNNKDKQHVQKIVIQ